MKLTEALYLLLNNELDISLFMDIIKDNESNEELINKIQDKLENRKVYILTFDEDNNEYIKAVYSSEEQAEKNQGQYDHIEKYEIDALVLKQYWTTALNIQDGSLTGTFSGKTLIGKNEKYKSTPTIGYSHEWIRATSYTSEEHSVQLAREFREDYINQAIKRTIE